jgi:trehalose 6-phosphate phosphatase
VSGRPLDRLKQFLAGAHINLVAEHGAVSSIADQISLSPVWPKAWDGLLLEAEQKHIGLCVECKSTSIALHYRMNPALEPSLTSLAQKLEKLGCGNYVAVQSNMTIEVRPRQISKGNAIASMMARAPFAGRVPVFVGDDDVSDAPGFEAVKAAGGIALHVGRDFGGSTARVRGWLSSYGDVGAQRR